MDTLNGTLNLPAAADHVNNGDPTVPTPARAVNRNSERSQKKRRRRTKAQIEQLERQIVEILREDNPQSVRHVFYRLTDPRLPEPVEKTDAAYKGVVRRLVTMRKAGTVPYGWISDSSRMGYHVATYRGPQDFLRRVTGFYRLNEWELADTHVEVWCESRSIAGVLRETCQRLGVSLYPSGGFSSESFIYEAAEDIRYEGKPVVLLYVGDYDPAGVWIDRDIIGKMRRHLPDHDIELRRLAITAEQIEQHDLPTKPRKKGDRRRLDITATVEAEALPAATLRAMVENAVHEYLDPEVRERLRVSEAAQRETIRALGDRLPQGLGGGLGA